MVRHVDVHYVQRDVDSQVFSVVLLFVLQPYKEVPVSLVDRSWRLYHELLVVKWVTVIIYRASRLFLVCVRGSLIVDRPPDLNKS